MLRMLDPSIRSSARRSRSSWLYSLMVCSTRDDCPNRATLRDPEPSYPAWKAAALKALQRLHAPAATVTPERIWTQLYIRRAEPAEAAASAGRQYHSTRPPSWLKRSARANRWAARAPLCQQAQF